MFEKAHGISRRNHETGIVSHANVSWEGKAVVVPRSDAPGTGVLATVEVEFAPYQSPT